MRLRWPPSPLGLGTPLNLAFASPQARPSLLLATGLGVATPLVMVGLDLLLFAGVSQDRIRLLGAEPLLTRCLIILYSAVTEELLYRVVVSTLVAWLAFLLLRRTRHGRPAAIWVGILAAAVLFGLAHVANLPDVPFPVLRALTLNGLPAVVLGWLYWWRGLESAVWAHLVADAVLYLALPLVV